MGKGRRSAAKLSVASAKPGTSNPYEAQKQANIERNFAVFQDLGISNMAAEVTGVQVSKGKKMPQLYFFWVRTWAYVHEVVDPNFVCQLLL